MKDFLKKDLQVGDEIVACVPHGRNSGASLVRGKVLGFTNTLVRVEIPSYNWNQPEERKISPGKVVKIDQSSSPVVSSPELQGQADN